MDKPNYIVHLNNTGKDYNCDTKEEVWETIKKAGWSGHKVWSPNGLDISEFIPF